MLRTKPLRRPRLDRDMIRARCMYALGIHVHVVHARTRYVSAVCARARNMAAVGLRSSGEFLSLVASPNVSVA